MSLVDEIEGYTISVFRNDDNKGHVILETDLRLSKVGGGKVKNPEDLICIIEDAVFNDRAD